MTTVKGTARTLPWPLAAAAAVAVALAGCGSGNLETGGQSVLFSALGERAVSALRPDEEGDASMPRLRPGQRVRVDPALIEGVTVPVLLAHLDARGSVATMARVAVNDGVATWQSGDAVSLSIRSDAILVATRGLGPDLMVADVEALDRALRSGGGSQLRRVHRHLDGDLQLGRAEWTCTLVPRGPEEIALAGRTRATLRFEERCTAGPGAEEDFVNLYWRDPGRMLVWQSRQWISAEIGVVNLQRLVE